jgi:iron complex transport system substrate-binding protein
MPDLVTRRRSPLLLVLALAALATIGAWALGRLADPHERRAPVTTRETTVVSLAPAITETLFAIGAGERIVAVSDFCSLPPHTGQLPRVGTAITPDFERIAHLQPTLILTDAHTGPQRLELDHLGRLQTLPWLSLGDVVSSIRRLGTLTGRDAEAERLATRLQARLALKPPPDAPRVLLVYGSAASGAGHVWFIQPNSLHGAALRAAGARNVVTSDVRGAPRMSLERVVDLDPDLIIVLTESEMLESAARERLLAGFRALHSLRAVQAGRIAVLADPSVFATGPRILRLVERLKTRISTLQADA